MILQLMSRVYLNNYIFFDYFDLKVEHLSVIKFHLNFFSYYHQFFEHFLKLFINKFKILCEINIENKNDLR